MNGPRVPNDRQPRPYGTLAALVVLMAVGLGAVCYGLVLVGKAAVALLFS